MNRETGSAAAIGAPLERVDGRLKVTGAATYVAEQRVAGLAHAALVQSTIARGRGSTRRRPRRRRACSG
jgi:CO/xanthine dehydrogenase Mo-binding subunit